MKPAIDLIDYSTASITHLFNKCGLYYLVLAEEVVYIGLTNNLAIRPNQHKDKEHDRIYYKPVSSKHLVESEIAEIALYRPRLNKTKGGQCCWIKKHPDELKMTVNLQIPRKIVNQNGGMNAYRNKIYKMLNI